jgi:hypothetical protein
MHGQLRSDVLIMNDFPGSQSILGPGAPQPIYGTLMDADWYIFQYRQTQYGLEDVNYRPHALLKTRTPIYEVSYQGVPLMGLYRVTSKADGVHLVRISECSHMTDIYGAR